MASALQVVCLDLMGTVLYDPYREAVMAATGMDLDALHAVKHPHSWPDFETGLIDEAEFAERFYADPRAGHPFDLAAFNDARRAGYRFLPGMRELLDDLHGHVDRVVASNYPIWIDQLVERFGFERCFESVWASHHLGVRKPDPVFFDLLLSKLGVSPAACLFVDDRLENCKAAEAAGLRSHRFTGAGDLRERLEREGVWR